MFYARNNFQHILLHKIGIPLNYLSNSLRVLVILARMFYGSEIFIIVLLMYQIQDISYLGIGVSKKKIAIRHCHMPAILLLFLFFNHLEFLLHLKITFSRIFPIFEHYFFLYIIQKLFAYFYYLLKQSAFIYMPTSLAFQLTKIYIEKIVYLKTTLCNSHCRQ